MIRYEAPLTLQFKVTDAPALTELGDAVKFAICGALPWGTLDAV